MLKNNKNVIYISREKLVVANVKTRPPLEIKESKEYNWTPEDLPSVLQKAKKENKLDKLNLLLADDISYTVSITLDEKANGAELRGKVLEAITQEIPDALTDDVWDYKISKRFGEKMEIVAFAPVVELFTIIKKALKAAELTIVAVEPEIVAKTRHENPLIGIALKKDIKGKDEEVLNLDLNGYRLVDRPTPVEDKTVTSDDNKIEIGNGGNSKKKSRSRFLIIILFVVLAICGSIVTYVLLSRNAVSPEIENEPTPSETVTPTHTISEEKESPELDLSTYTVFVQNGSGVAGKAAAVGEILEAEGFTEIETGNADSADYELTQVRIDKEVSDEVFKAIDRALNSDYEIEQGEVLTEESEYDVVIIVGIQNEN